MTSRSPDAASNKPPVLSSNEIDELLSMTLIANLATLDDDGGIHLLPMWFLRVDKEICIPTSRYTHKYRNLRERPHASVMIDVSHAGLNLKGVMIRGRVKLMPQGLKWVSYSLTDSAKEEELYKVLQLESKRQNKRIKKLRITKYSNEEEKNLTMYHLLFVLGSIGYRIYAICTNKQPIP
jgi:nitroimidazol reductase NimA-like FMN-containing flavoprotein (pyridoxamine 5'-phosphate oxidase superfamily)